jgi:hypothetical protein
VAALVIYPAADNPRTLALARCSVREAHTNVCVRLNPESIYAEQSARDSLQFFTDPRNKSSLHDGNSYTQRQVLAPINSGNKPNKVEGIIAVNLFFDVRGVENQRSLRRLLEDAQRWVAQEFDSLRDTIKTDLEQMSYDELTKQPDAKFLVPTVGDMRKNPIATIVKLGRARMRILFRENSHNTWYSKEKIF